MRATEHAAPPQFRGSISRRLTILSIHFFLLVLVVGGLSVYKARTIARTNAESLELYTHIDLIDRLQGSVFHLRGEVQDALLGAEHSPPTAFARLAADLRAEWTHFERMHFRAGAPWGAGAIGEKALYERVDRDLEDFLGASANSLASDPGQARRDFLSSLHELAHRVEAGVRQMRELHQHLIEDRVRHAEREMSFILWAYGAFMVLGGLAVAAGSVLFVRRMAIPLRRLEAAALAVAQGGFEGRVPVTSRDEIGLLAHTFNWMAEALSERDAQVRRRAQEAQALYRIGTEISSLLKLDRILQTVVESARAMLQTEAAAICLLRDGGPRLDVVAVAGPWDTVMGSRPATCCDDRPADGSPSCLRCHEGHMERGAGHLSAALKRGDQVLGALCVGTAAPRGFGDAERDLLGGLAAQAAIAIENARLYETVRGMGAAEERERIAREMHDGLAQALGFLNLKLALAERGLDGGAAEPTRQALAEMRKVAGDAYDEVRQAIFGLRTMVSRGLGLVPTLTEYLHEFSQQTGLQIHLEASERDGGIRFAPEVEVQLVRIIQEALHNVWKHARARSACVRLRREGAEALVAVEDDGAGFDPAASPGDGRRHFGLATMRERAEAVGGVLAIRSGDGNGTHVVVRLPLAAPRREGSAEWGEHRWNASA